MELLSVLIAAAAFIVSIPLSIAALVYARRSTNAAEGSRDEAKRSADTATEALAEARRSADAAERQAAAAEALIPEPEEPDPPIRWQLELLKVGKWDSTRWAIRNIGTETATGVKIDRERAPDVADVEFDDEDGVVKPGCTVRIWLIPMGGMSASTELWLTRDGLDGEINVPLT